jgi:hypothetical protein
MSQSITEWQAPCGCRLQFAFDPDEPAETRLHTAVEFPERKGCAEHFDADHHAHFRKIRTAHLDALTKREPGHGIKLVVEAGGGIRDQLPAPAPPAKPKRK